VEISLLSPPTISRSPLTKPNLDPVRQKADMLTTRLCYHGLAANTYRNSVYPLWWQSILLLFHASGTVCHSLLVGWPISTNSADFSKKRLKPCLSSRSVPSWFVVPYSCNFILGLASSWL